MSMHTYNQNGGRAVRHTIVFSALLVCAFGAIASSQVQLDVCGCNNNPASLGSFDTVNAATFPPDTNNKPGLIEIPLAADGVMVFDSISLRPRATDPGGALTVRFVRNAANSPVTLLVSGNVTIASNVTVSVAGDNGVSGTQEAAGKGGLGGPGGMRGGDGAYQLVNFATQGGAGLGPGGGGGAVTNAAASGRGANGTFAGAPDLLPLVGGSGGGGGASTSAAANCSGGGGGGGGGALLVAANGSITIDGQIVADGGTWGFYSASSCASGGGAGSGGAVRLISTSILGAGRINARGGGDAVGQRAQSGSIRLEALNNTLNVSATDPIASRAPGPGPTVNPITPTVAITSVGGQPVPIPPQGGFGAVDVFLPAPGTTDIGLSTAGVPVGTTVIVTVKPRVGGAPTPISATLTNCDGTGACLANVPIALAAGAYSVEARATFQMP